MDVDGGCPLPTVGARVEAEAYREFMSSTIHLSSGLCENLQTTPLTTSAVKNAILAQTNTVSDDEVSFALSPFDQCALLGFHSGQHAGICENEPILMNINAPNSTFICGSQGSGKSYTLNCMLEGCLLANQRIGTVTNPIAGLTFHYDPDSTGMIAETAHLCSVGVPVSILVSRSNEYIMKAAYTALSGANRHLTVTPLLLRPSDLSMERMNRLMAFSDRESAMPLYMSVASRILRQMAIERSENGFDYTAFKSALERENLTKDQLGPLHLRLELLESFLDVREARAKVSLPSLFDVEPGTLTIVDLSDPFMDPATACVLFDICLGLFKEHRPPCGLVVALDEAHKFMTTSLTASQFTESLLRTIREQRHNAMRVIVATQEPTVSDKLLDLCSVSIIHRFTSPAWYGTIRAHLGAASKYVSTASQEDTLFKEIMELGVGEILVFAPSAFLHLTSTGRPDKLGAANIQMRTRRRVGNDGGRSVLASASSVRSRNETWNAPSVLDVARGNRIAVTELASTGARTLPGRHIYQQPRVRLDLRGLVETRSHLVLVCWLCSKAILVVFDGFYLPTLPDVDENTLRAGLAYATCVQCQVERVEEKKPVLKHFDYVQGKAFREGKERVSGEFRDRLRIGLLGTLGSQITVLRRNGELVYFFLRIVQRLITEGSGIWILCPSRDRDGAASVDILAHEDGSFLKASLRPNDITS